MTRSASAVALPAAVACLLAFASLVPAETIGPSQVRYVKVSSDGSARIHVGVHSVCTKQTLLLRAEHVARRALLSLALAAKATSAVSMREAEVDGCFNGHPIVSGLTWIRAE